MKTIFAYSHIPKAGGTTLIDILRSHYGWAHVDIISRSGTSPKNYMCSDFKSDLKLIPFM